jgi:hypothetical protein
MMLDKREAKIKRMKGATRKLSRAILEFYKSTIIPMVSVSFVRTGFRLNQKGLLTQLTVIPGTVLDRIRMRGIPLEESLFPEWTETAQPAARAERRRAKLQAYADKVSDPSSFCG